MHADFIVDDVWVKSTNIDHIPNINETIKMRDHLHTSRDAEAPWIVCKVIGIEYIFDIVLRCTIIMSKL
jgi:hypothetical protein